MFYPFDLVLETNKLLKRFEGIGFKIVTEIMNDFRNPNIRKLFAKMLSNYNIRIKIIDDLFKNFCVRDDIFNKKLQIMIEDKILHSLYLEMSIIMYNINNDFAQRYDELYFEKTFRFIKELWTAMPEENMVKNTEKGFKDLFDEFHNQVVKRYPNIVVKELQDINRMYRCRSWKVNEGYELMIPDEDFVKDNRWNPDGVAYLYLACGDSKEMYDDKINVVQKTCFEEIRLQDGCEVAICQFKPTKMDAKIIDLCYEGLDLLKLTQELTIPPIEFSQTVIDEINSNADLTEIMKSLVQESTKEEFARKSEPYIKNIMKMKGFNKKIEETVFSKTSLLFLGLIDESIFEPVDKTDDPELKAYIPFRFFSKYLIDKGYDGIIFRSTRMNKIGLMGKNLVLFNKNHATYIEGTMKKYKYLSNKYIELS